MKGLRLLPVLLLEGAACAQLSDDCLGCMCEAYDGCVMEDPPCYETSWGSYVCSPWKFNEPYWIDGGHLGKDFETCGGNWACSADTVRGYLHRYAGPSATCEKYARTHMGGPLNLGSIEANKFWCNVKACIEDGGYTIPQDH